jgi:putative spermidine/putrescine transport system substrate-binding protein
MEEFQEDEYEFLRRLEEERSDRRTLLKRGVAAGVGLTLLSLPAAALAARRQALRNPPLLGRTLTLKELVAEAKKEGGVHTVGLPPTWANYGEIMATFSKKFGIPLENSSPAGLSAAAINQAIRSLKGDPRQPDTADVNPGFAIDGANEGLYTRYYPMHFSKVPRAMRDGRGFWTGNYYGVVAFGVNTQVIQNVPKSWNDLLKPEYKNSVALNGSPLTAGVALQAVFSSSLGNGGSLNDIGPGIDFFAKLKSVGNYIPIQATPQTITSGQTPITVNYDYLTTAYGNLFPAAKIKTVIPANAVLGAYYCQAVSATAPHPWAGRLWEEFLISDQGGLLFLKGYTHPSLFNDMVARKVIPKALLDALPNPAAYANIRFANRQQAVAAQTKIQTEWLAKVGT